MQEYAFKPTATTTKRKSFVIGSTRSSSTLPTKQETKCNIDGLEFENSKRKSEEGCQTIIAAKKQITTTKSTHLKELPKETTIQEEDLEKKVENHINQLELDCCQKKEEILSIKNTLSDPYLKSETEVLESLRKLQKLVDSKQILQETMIGRTVNSIKKTCKSNKIRHLALILIMEWRKLVDKWLELEASATTGENTKNNEIELQKHVSFFSVPISDKQEKQHDENLILLKIEGSKRKLHEDYQEAENAKKQRSVKFFDFHELLEKKNAIQDKAPDTRPQIQYQPRPYRRKIRVNMRMQP